MRAELRRYCAEAASQRGELQQAEAELRARIARLKQQAGDSRAAATELVLLGKHLHGVGAALPVLRDTLQWAARIADHREGCSIGFVASDTAVGGSDAMWAPPGFVGGRDAVQAARAVAARYGADMRAEIQRLGWPPPQDVVRSVRGPVRCTDCGEGYYALWVNRGVCLQCEAASRAAGQCPFCTRGAAEGWCPHARRCTVCDQWSCAECRLHRGDGDEVAALLATLRPDAVFLDFDRTLATTKTGGSPLRGNHAADEELLRVLKEHPNSRIVTRNSHLDDIATFLARRGVDVRGRVHGVGGKVGGDKADVVLAPEHLAPGGAALFVDDNIREACNPRIASDPRVHRVLFARAL
eukprot:TRINITY_DN42729_c0_g1_i3.p2 TRINITY_DN42729_c0_g1~~TRINITY_DN42729_c0_g1_i3.p2  ORF type:complete len:354 (+),score=124.43 TRINITY_DN42729_c0_g1_i3:935-1996(+)